MSPVLHPATTPDPKDTVSSPSPTARRRVRTPGAPLSREEQRAQQTWVDGAEPELPVRATPPQRVVFHLGPTNSGKTYESLQALAAVGSGVYAAPLRQLAHEAYAKLSAVLPAGTVGLSTGEEEIDPGAPIVCCTVEKAPPAGELLVLDESHWVADPDRGHHWARLLLTGAYREMHLISAAEALLLLKPLVADAVETEIVVHKRLSRLDVLPAPVKPRRCGRRRWSSRSPARPSTPSPRSWTGTAAARSASSTARCRRPPAATSSPGSPAVSSRCW